MYNAKYLLASSLLLQPFPAVIGKRRERIGESDTIYVSQYLLRLTDDEGLKHQPSKFNETKALVVLVR